MSAPLLTDPALTHLAFTDLDPVLGVGVTATLCSVAAAVTLWRLRTARLALDDAVEPEALPSPVPQSIPASARLLAPPESPVLVETGAAGPPRGAHRGAPRPGVGYTELSRSHAALGRAEAAARAQWAADLRLFGSLMPEHGEQLPERLLALDADSPRAAVEAAREQVRALMAGSESGWSAAPMLAPVDHLPQLPSTDDRSAPWTTDSPASLHAQALSWMERAERSGTYDLHAARVEARRADLASLDAVLLESARRFGDESLVSVRLRQQLADAALHDHDQARDIPSDWSSDRALPTGQPSLGEAVRQTRQVLRTVVEPHELALLEEYLAPEPLG